MAKFSNAALAAFTPSAKKLKLPGQSYYPIGAVDPTMVIKLDEERKKEVKQAPHDAYMRSKNKVYRRKIQGQIAQKAAIKVSPQLEAFRVRTRKEK